MRVRSKLVVQLLDALEASGLPRREVLADIGLDETALSDARGYVSWNTLAAALEAGFERLGRDPERMRAVGRFIASAPSYALLQRLARSVVSVSHIYEIAARWGSVANLPHLPLEYEMISERRLRFSGRIPEPHAPSIALNHVFEGILTEVPTLLGLPRATIVESVVTPRSIDVVVDLPASRSIASRIRRIARAAFLTSDTLALLEEQRRELADALREAQRSTAEDKEILDRLPDLVMIHRDGVLLWLNRENLRTLGYERNEELAGKAMLDLVEPASRELIRARMQQPVDENTPELSEIRLLARDGRIVIVEIAPAQLVSFEGRPARLIVGRDVTERARLQQQLLIAERMASIGLLAAGVAHEVNNPLAYVLNNIEIAIRGLLPLGEAAGQSRAVLGVALEGVDRIRAIVRDLLALSRVDDAVVGPIDALAVVESILALAGKSIADRAVLAFEHSPAPPVRGSVARLGQVLLNLITNALEAMRGNPREANVLRVVVRPASGGGAIIEVGDNGVGISPEHASRIFEPFFTTKAPGSGTGLGLAISQRLVTEMGGQLTFESTPYRGSTFRVTLPPSEAEESRPPPARHARASP